jgi:FkbM family methyltransferase
MRTLRNTFWELSQDDEKRLAFYKQFISPGDLVFDVGANMGNRAKVFYSLGATVVAVEPQRECADFLAHAFLAKPSFHLVRKALGASVGTDTMLISTAHTISSLSSDWVRSVQESGRFTEYQWNRAETVSIDTLDNLILKYGYPAFIKIDVEGFEDQVIAGLSSPARVISMEFTPEFIESTLKCIAWLCRIGEPQFQISLGESMEFTLPEWVTGDEIGRELSAVQTSAFGDLYARFGTREDALKIPGTQ